MKVDVEGHEYKVMQSARRLLSEHRAEFVVFEFNQAKHASQVSSGVQVAELLFQFGYKSAILCGHEFKPPDDMPFAEYIGTMRQVHSIDEFRSQIAIKGAADVLFSTHDVIQ